MPRIMPSSWAGTPMRESGAIRRSKAAVMSRVVVVRVSRLIPMSRSSRRQPMKTADCRPFSLMQMMPNSKYT